MGRRTNLWRTAVGGPTTSKLACHDRASLAVIPNRCHVHALFPKYTHRNVNRQALLNHASRATSVECFWRSCDLRRRRWLEHFSIVCVLPVRVCFKRAGEYCCCFRPSAEALRKGAEMRIIVRPSLRGTTPIISWVRSDEGFPSQGHTGSFPTLPLI